MTDVIHTPKGSMCVACKFAEEVNFCGSLDFTTMKPIETVAHNTATRVVVKCTEFQAKNEQK